MRGGRRRSSRRDTGSPGATPTPLRFVSPPPPPGQAAQTPRRRAEAGGTYPLRGSGSRTPFSAPPASPPGRGGVGWRWRGRLPLPAPCTCRTPERGPRRSEAGAEGSGSRRRRQQLQVPATGLRGGRSSGSLRRQARAPPAPPSARAAAPN